MMPPRSTTEQLRAGEAATWGGMPKPKLRVLSFRPVRRNTLFDFVTVRFGSRLKLNDCLVHLHLNGRAWVALPGKPVMDEHGRHKRDANGKPAYVPMGEWRDRATSDRFSEIGSGFLRERFPRALNGEDEV